MKCNVYIKEEFVLMKEYKNYCIDEKDVMLNCHYCKGSCYLHLCSRVIQNFKKQDGRQM